MKIRVTKEFKFEMAHTLWNYDGKCKNIHGHSYKLFVTIIGSPLTDANSPKAGMVMDFGDLKHIVNQTIIDKYDHALVVNSNVPTEKFKQIPQLFNRLEIVDYQPTCENMVADFAQKIKEKLPDYVQLHSLKMHETATSYAEWYASDN